MDAISELVKQAPTHPYAKLGETKFKELAQQAEEFLKMQEFLPRGSRRESLSSDSNGDIETHMAHA